MLGVYSRINRPIRIHGFGIRTFRTLFVKSEAARSCDETSTVWRVTPPAVMFFKKRFNGILGFNSPKSFPGRCMFYSQGRATDNDHEEDDLDNVTRGVSPDKRNSSTLLRLVINSTSSVENALDKWIEGGNIDLLVEKLRKSRFREKALQLLERLESRKNVDVNHVEAGFEVKVDVKDEVNVEVKVDLKVEFDDDDD